jgi:hypothetical protein
VQRLLVEWEVGVDQPRQALGHNFRRLFLFQGVGDFGALDGFAGRYVLLLLRREARLG